MYKINNKVLIQNPVEQQKPNWRVITWAIIAIICNTGLRREKEIRRRKEKTRI